MDDFDRRSNSLKNGVCFTCLRSCNRVAHGLRVKAELLDRLVGKLPVEVWFNVMSMVESTRGHRILYFVESDMPPIEDIIVDRLSQSTNQYYWHVEFRVCSVCCRKSIGAMSEYPYFRKQSWFLCPQEVQSPFTNEILRKTFIPYRFVVYYNMVDLPQLKQLARTLG